MIGDRDAVLSALQSILKSKHFAQSESLSNLLSYIVEPSLAGHGSELKEYILGREVFGRGDSFDPKTDTIVRVQASRLRSKLRDYYAADCDHHSVVIAVPTGAYSAQFLANGKERARTEGARLPKWVAFAGAAALVAVAAYWLGNRARTAVPPGIRSVAVLPFRNLSGDAAQDYLADGLTDNLITDLGKTPGLRVISRTTAMSYVGTRKSLTTVARELDVDALVEGSVTLAGDNLRVNANLIDARGRERSLWTQTLEHGARDIAGLQREMQRKVAQQIRPESKALPPAGLASPHPEAYAAYLKGRYFAAQASEASHGQALEWFAKATALDPRLSVAKAGEALSYLALADFYLPPRDAAPQARAAANHALALDPSSAEAYMARGSVELFFDWNAQAAETDLRAALKANPNLAQANLLYAMLCGTMGRFEEALAAGRRALQLDPLSPYLHSYFQWLLLVAGRYEEVEKTGEAAIQLQPNSAFPYMWNGFSHALRGDFRKAEPLMEHAAGLDQTPMITLNLGLMQALNGKRVQARAQLEKVHRIGKRRYVCPYEIGSVHAAMGEMDDAYRWMDKGLADRCNCMVWIMSESWMKPLRDDPRFPALKAKVGLWNQVRSF